MHVYDVYFFLLLFISCLNHVLTMNALVSYPYFNLSAGTANVIVAVRMVPKMRGIVRGTANGGTEVAQGVNSAQGVRETAGRCKYGNRRLYCQF